MAELALGLTKTVVEGALSRIQLAIEEEEKLKEGVQQDLEFITGEFQMMQSFLKVANKERARKNEVVRAWVRQLRDLAFDVEDWVEFVNHLEKDKSRCSCWWRLVPSWAVPRHLAPSRLLDEAAAEMKLLKARVHDVSQRNTRYNLFSRDDSGSCSGLDSKTVKPTVADLSSTAFQMLRQMWMDETDRLRKVGSLQKLITSEVVGDDLQVIWLWESDGRFKSQLIYKAYQDEEFCGSFKLCAWVKIMHPFNLQAFLNTLAAQLLFVGSSHHEATSDGLTSTAELIQQATNQQRYLVVLEQVSDLVVWNTIRKYLPDNNKGSRIVVSTQNMRHAILCTRKPYLVSELRYFTDGRPSICAFYQKAAVQSDSDVDTLIGKIKPGSVISVYGGFHPSRSAVVKRSYLSIKQNPGMRFQTFKWVPASSRFSLADFSRRLLLNLDVCGFYDGDLKELFDIFGGSKFEKVLCKMNEEELIERSRRILNTNCLIVIDGLGSKKDWDDMRTILPSEPTKCCVIVVTDDETLARYCLVDDNEDQLVQVGKTGYAPPPISACIREMHINEMRGISYPHLSKRRLLYDRLINDTFRSAPVTSVWGISGVGKSTLVKWSCTKKMLHPTNAYMRNFNNYYWVDVPYPFTLAELSLRLLRALCQDYHIYEGNERAMIDMLEGDRDSSQECRFLLQQRSGWLLVLDGLSSTDDWDSINEAFCLSQPTYQSNKTIVVTNEQHVAMYCANKDDKQVISVQGLKADEALKFFEEKVCVRTRPLIILPE